MISLLNYLGCTKVEEHEEHVSKSQKKREASFLQAIGVKLIELSLEQLEKLPLTESLLTAIVAAKSLKSFGAKRRQAQLIGRLMREADSEEIVNAYQELMHESDLGSVKFHEVELWRERLIADKKALTEFINKYPEVDNQHLRQLIKKAQMEKRDNKPAGAGKLLFRFIRSYVHEL